MVFRLGLKEIEAVIISIIKKRNECKIELIHTNKYKMTKKKKMQKIKNV
jgi:hypothetical protein